MMVSGLPVSPAPASPPEAGHPASAAAQTLVVFRVCGSLCAIPVEAVREIVPMAWLSRPPGAPPLLFGILNLGGTAVPVVRLGHLLGLPDEAPAMHTPLLVLHGAGHPVALLVQAVSRILTVPGHELLPVPEQRLADAAIRVDEQLVMILALDRLLLEQERRCLEHWTGLEQRRLGELEGRADVAGD